MASNNFFDKKQHWSKVKDKVVSGYLTPYCAKLLATQKPLKIVDCFAGRGKFEDGEDGSPIMIAKVIKEILKNQKSYQNKNIEACFIEEKYHNDLKKNLWPYYNYKVIDGKFEDNISQIIEKNQNDETNLFLYIDPYGIKSLSFKIFNSLRDMDNISTEVLMNFNSFGFLREGFRLLDKNIPAELSESNYESDDKNSIERMNEIANGTYWQDIIKDKNNKKITMHAAEERFVREYSSQLKLVYKYVINIPIKVKKEHLPKYRLIFGTNHREGLFLMVDAMKKSWDYFLSSINDKSLFEEFEYPDYNLGKVDLEKEILNFIPENEQISLSELLKQLIEIFGISFSTNDYIKILKKLSGEEKNSIGGLFAANEIRIIRNYLTNTGQKARDFNYNNEIYIERLRCLVNQK